MTPIWSDLSEVNVFICHSYHDNDNCELRMSFIGGFESAFLTLIDNISIHNPLWSVNGLSCTFSEQVRWLRVWTGTVLRTLQHLPYNFLLIFSLLSWATVLFSLKTGGCQKKHTLALHPFLTQGACEMRIHFQNSSC